MTWRAARLFRCSARLRTAADTEPTRAAVDTARSNCSHGWLRTPSAVKRSLRSAVSAPLIRSFALSLTLAPTAPLSSPYSNLQEVTRVRPTIWVLDGVRRARWELPLSFHTEAFESSETEKENYCLLRAEILLNISDLGVRYLFRRNLTSPLLVRGPHYTHVYWLHAVYCQTLRAS